MSSDPTYNEPGESSRLPEAMPLWREDENVIIGGALDRHAPSSVFAMFSGGNDSLATLHWTMQNAPLTAAVHIDTGTALPGVREHVVKVCADIGVPLIVLERGPEEYERMCLAEGMPGPGAHRYPYVRLKERMIDKLIAEHKTKWNDRILLVTGARRHESVRRMGKAVAEKRDGCTVWVNPLIDWTGHDVRTYRASHDLALSDTAALCHRSGECNCGAFAAPETTDDDAIGEREFLADLFPEWFERIDWLERRNAENDKPWLWGQRPPAWAVKRMNDIATAEGCGPNVGAMCEGCIQTIMELPNAV